MSIAATLKQAGIFHGLTPEQLELIAAIAQEREYHTGDLLFEENSTSDELYIIGRGEVDLQINPMLAGEDEDIGPITIATLRHGQSFGEVALVDQGARTASVRCARYDTCLVVIPRDKLMQLCDEHPQLGYRLMRNLAVDLAAKLRDTDMRFREQLFWTFDNLSRS
jgi:CRP/FNR family cyclic AMP-dependent transcriptional regulator